MINACIHILPQSSKHLKNNISRQQDIANKQIQDSVSFQGLPSTKNQKQLFVNTASYNQIQQLANSTPENDVSKLMTQIKILCEYNYMSDVHSNAWIFAFLLDPESSLKVKPVLEEALRSSNSTKLQECFKEYLKVLGTGYLES